MSSKFRLNYRLFLWLMIKKTDLMILWRKAAYLITNTSESASPQGGGWLYERSSKMTFTWSISFFILGVMLLFMLLALFGAIAVPFWVWVIWTLVGLVVHALGR